MPKVYLRATGPNSFKWVTSLKQATADYKQAVTVTLKQLKSTKLEEIPPRSQQLKSKWVISTDK